MSESGKRDLRSRATKCIRNTDADVERMSPEELRTLLHELQVHQAELEVQNEDLKEAHLEVARLRDRYRELYEFAPVAYMTLDEQYRIVEDNLAARLFLGCDRGDLQGAPLTRFVADDDADECNRYLRRVKKSETRQSATMKFVTPRDGIRYGHLETDAVYASEGSLAYRVTVADITGRIRIERELEESQEILRMATSAAGVGIWRYDLSAGVCHWNDQLYLLLGLEPGDGAEKPDRFFEFIHPEDKDRLPDFRHVLNNMEEIDDEFRVIRPDGEVRWLAARGSLQRDDGGRPRYYSGVNFDITRQKVAEQRYEQINATLSEKVRKRSAEAVRRADLLQRLTHQLGRAEDKERERIARYLHDDLQQQLAAVKMRLSMMVDGHLPPESFAAQAESCMNLLGETIERTRELSREMSPLALRQLGLLNCLDNLARDMEKKHGLATTVVKDPEAEPDSVAIASFLYRAARELLFNVVKHSGCMEARLKIERKNHWIVLRVSDRGKGDEVCKAYAKRETEKGFGLFSIEERAKYLGGRMKVRSFPDDGWRIDLYVPNLPEKALEKADAGPLEAREERSDTRSDGGDVPGTELRIVIVDDHDVMREGLANLIEGHSTEFSVVGQADNGLDAVKLAGTLRPHVVLMDISMPGMGGVEATREIRARYPEISVVGLSMHENPETRKRILSAGAVECLSKSEPAEVILHALRENARRAEE
ncbi:MAG: response regulator [Desulfatibacillaceae bacterium]